MLLKIGELAKRVGLTVRTLHHYDNIGLLSPSLRSEGGFRLYKQDDVARLHTIQALKQFGCSLSEIRAFLATPGASIIQLITQQISVLDKQVQRAITLRERLIHLRERIKKGEETGLTDWLVILEMMTMYEKHLSREELDRLRSNKACGELDREWRQLVPKVQDSMDRGISPESKEAQGLAWRWMQLLRDITGNDPNLAIKLGRIHRGEQKAQLFAGITSEMLDYITRSFAAARAAILARYLSPSEVDTVLERQAAHASQWPPLITEVRQQIKRGVKPTDTAIQALARRWESLFRESYWGDDPQLEAKIRAAFRKEPDLRVSVGIDSALIVFVERAIRHLHAKPDNAKMQPL